RFLYSLRLFGAKFGLENTLQLAQLAGSPQERLRFIHVAGTNGKGSTCAMLESIYRAAGLRVGLFTSPHLVSFRERIQVNRQCIGEADVVRLVAEMQPWLASFPMEHHPTFFEVVTVMALLYFAEQECDLVVWETGLGGRLDATNIVTPLASVITNIALDHQQWLGETIPQIAAEKAGIIKPGVPVVTAVDDPRALAVIETTAKRLDSRLTIVKTDHAARHALHVPLSGEHQRANAALAVATVAQLQSQIPVGDDAIRSGMETVCWPGRMQTISRPSGQRLILDGAHNVAGARALRSALERQLSGARCTLVLGVLGDKEWQQVCEVLAPVADKIMTVPVASERSADVRALADACRAVTSTADITACSSLAEALERCSADPIVVIAGSLYLVGDALALLGVLPSTPDEQALNDWTGIKPSNPPHQR
ncbi:MAG TPA: folylpolyglutamate synthase/dihydrofolate synthase family protein, partial [Verrucomicrobiota bacterium]|nr:folylpolyglutamate synthase/dihydrofolate synthase family protein [Verrucomicrobiota bacterium]